MPDASLSIVRLGALAPLLTVVHQSVYGKNANQNKMTIQIVVANQDRMVETLNGYGINMNSAAKVTKVIMNLK
jgi:hypothetical protein